MFRCDKHGVLKSEWCEDCKKVVVCDCSILDSTRFKDLIYDCELGEKTTSIILSYCKTCGKNPGVKMSR